MDIHHHDTAVLLIDAQGEGADEGGAAGNIERLRRAARRDGFRVFGDEGGFHDLALQLLRAGVRRVVLAGMSASVRVESRLRELLELGFAVVVAKDATTGPRPDDWGDGYAAGELDFAFLAHAVRSTDELVSAMGRCSAAGGPRRALGHCA